MMTPRRRRATALDVPAMRRLLRTALLPLALVVVPAHLAELATDSSLPADIRDLDLDPFTLPLPHDLWLAILHTAYVLVPLSLVVLAAGQAAREHLAGVALDVALRRDGGTPRPWDCRSCPRCS